MGHDNDIFLILRRVPNCLFSCRYTAMLGLLTPNEAINYNFVAISYLVASILCAILVSFSLIHPWSGVVTWSSRLSLCKGYHNIILKFLQFDGLRHNFLHIVSANYNCKTL